MKLSSITTVLMAVSSFFIIQSSLAQVVPASGEQLSAESKSWAIFAGGSFERGGSTNFTGWDLSVSEYPYKAVPWVGGTIEGSGTYYTQSGVTTGLYGFMGGPVISLRRSKLQPFAHVLLGESVEKTSMTVFRVSGSSSVSAFALDAGGGVDFPIRPAVAIRGQGDWLRDVKSNSTSFFKVAAGVVFRF
jgi:hypothetical protein